jgi:uncharacterized membrane protein YiaA
MISLLQAHPAYTGTVHLHNFLRWVIIVALILSLINAFKGKNGKETLVLMISSHVMLLLGLVQWFIGDWGLKQIKSMGMGAAMKNPVIRFFSVEHALMMIIAIVLITIGHRAAKTNQPKTKWYFVAALVIILLMTPWPWREAGRGLFPGMH